MPLSITIDNLLSWGPCRNHDKLRDLAADRERWTAIDILALDQPPGDLLWVVLRPELIHDRVLHELACDFAEHVLHLFEGMYPDDARPRAAIEAKRAWLREEVGEGQLRKAAAARAAAAAGEAAAEAARAARAARAAARAAGAARAAAEVAGRRRRWRGRRRGRRRRQRGRRRGRRRRGRRRGRQGRRRGRGRRRRRANVAATTVRGILEKEVRT